VKGGLIVHLGSGDGGQTAALRLNDGYLVHGLDTDAGNVEKARRYIQSRRLYGKVSVDTYDGIHLPYVDNMVNLLIADSLDRVSETEVMRVLAPCGVAMINGGKRVKSRPKDIDEWTHYLHDASNNAVAHDSVIGAPRHLQWHGGPKWSRHHDHLSSVGWICARRHGLMAGLPTGLRR